MSILEKIDGVAKGWKTHTTSATFVALTALVATKGIDLTQYVESIESVYIALCGAYAAIVTAFREIARRSES